MVIFGNTFIVGSLVEMIVSYEWVIFGNTFIVGSLVEMIVSYEWAYLEIPLL